MEIIFREKVNKKYSFNFNPEELISIKNVFTQNIKIIRDNFLSDEIYNLLKNIELKIKSNNIDKSRLINILCYYENFTSTNIIILEY